MLYAETSHSLVKRGSISDRHAHYALKGGLKWRHAVDAVAAPIQGRDQPPQSCRLHKPVVDHQTVLASRDVDRLTIMHGAFQNHPRQRILQLALNDALKWACAVGRIVALLGQPIKRGRL